MVAVAHRPLGRRVRATEVTVTVTAHLGQLPVVLGVLRPDLIG